MAFEDLIFRLQVQGANLRDGIRKAVNEIQQKQSVTVPVNVTVGAGQRAAIEKAVKAAAANLKDAVLPVAPTFQIKASGGQNNLVNQIKRLLRDAGKKAGQGFVLKVRPQIKIEGKITDAELLVKKGKEAGEKVGRTIAEEARAAIEKSRRRGAVAAEVARQTTRGRPVSPIGAVQRPRLFSGAEVAKSTTQLARALTTVSKQADTTRTRLAGALLAARAPSEAARRSLVRVGTALEGVQARSRIDFGEILKASQIGRFQRFKIFLDTLAPGLRSVGRAATTVLGPLGRLASTAAGIARIQVPIRGIGRAAAGAVRSVTRLTAALTRSVALLTGSGLLVGGPLFLPVAAVRGLASAFGDLADFGDTVRNSITLFSDQLAKLKGADRVEFTREKFEELGEQILEVGQRTGRSFDEVGKGLQAIISAGVGVTDVAERFEALNAASDLAVGGLTDIESAFRGLLPVQRAFGLGFQDAADGLFAIQRRGIAPIRELVPTLGRLAPFAAAVGIEFEELGAAIATITAQGVPVSQTVTGLRQTLATFAKQGSSKAREELEKLRKVIPGLNLQLNAQFLRTKGLIGVVRELEKVGGDNVSLILRRVRALQSLLPLLQARQRFEGDVAVIARREGEASAAAAVKIDSLRTAFERVKRSAEAFLISVAEQVRRFVDLDNIVGRLQGFLQRLSAQIRSLPTEEIRKFIDSLLTIEGITKIVDLAARAFVTGIGKILTVVLSAGPAITKAFIPLGLALAKGLGFVASKGVEVIGSSISQAAAEIRKEGGAIQGALLGLLVGAGIPAKQAAAATAPFATALESLGGAIGRVGQKLREQNAGNDISALAKALDSQGFGAAIDDFFSDAVKATNTGFQDLGNAISGGFGIGEGDRLENVLETFLSTGVEGLFARNISSVRDFVARTGIELKKFDSAIDAIDIFGKLKRIGGDPQEAVLKLSGPVGEEVRQVRSRLNDLLAAAKEARAELGRLGGDPSGIESLIKSQRESLAQAEADVKRLRDQFAKLFGAGLGTLSEKSKQARAQLASRVAQELKLIEFLKTNISLNEKAAARARELNAEIADSGPKIEQARSRLESLESELQGLQRVARFIGVKGFGVEQLLDRETGGEFKKRFSAIANEVNSFLGVGILDRSARLKLFSNFDSAGNAAVNELTSQFKDIDLVGQLARGRLDETFFTQFLQLSTKDRKSVLEEIGEVRVAFKQAAASFGPRVPLETTRAVDQALKLLLETLRAVEARYKAVEKATSDAGKAASGAASDADTFFVRVASRADSVRAVTEALGATLQEAADTAKDIGRPGNVSVRVKEKSEVQPGDRFVASKVDRLTEKVEGIASFLERRGADLGIAVATGANVGGGVDARQQTVIMTTPASERTDLLSEAARAFDLDPSIFGR